MHSAFCVRFLYDVCRRLSRTRLSSMAMAVCTSALFMQPGSVRDWFPQYLCGGHEVSVQFVVDCGRPGAEVGPPHGCPLCPDNLCKARQGAARFARGTVTLLNQRSAANLQQPFKCNGHSGSFFDPCTSGGFALFMR